MAEPRFSINIHVDDDVTFRANRVPSDGNDFVSLGIGWQSTVLMFTAQQAKALRDAVNEAYFLLRKIELEKEQAAQLRDWDDADSVYSSQPPVPVEEMCSIEHPCSMCQEYLDGESDYDPASDEYEPF